jgi:hypothetical protein
VKDEEDYVLIEASASDFVPFSQQYKKAKKSTSKSTKKHKKEP